MWFYQALSRIDGAALENGFKHYIPLRINIYFNYFRAYFFSFQFNFFYVFQCEMLQVVAHEIYKKFSFAYVDLIIV